MFLKENTIELYIIILFISIAIIYCIYYMYNKHCNILEKYSESNNASVKGYNYGEGHNSGREGTDKRTLTGQITLRPCQVYFVGEDQHKTCDDDSNSSKTCKYEFGDDWMEIDTILKDDSTNTYPKKIYNQNKTKTGIANQVETAQCFKRFDSDTDRRFLYQNNDLINYNYGGESAPDTIELNYYNDNDATYDKGNFISMTFNNNVDATTNYNNVISSICSKKLNAPMGLDSNLRFYKFILDKDNKITKIKEATFNPDLKSLSVEDIDMKKFLSANALKIRYSSLNNKFIITKDSSINPELVDIYRFKYNYLCNNEEGGVITNFKTDKFTNEKKYIEMMQTNSISKDLKYNNDLVRIPNIYKNHFNGLTSRDAIIKEINRLKNIIMQTYNSGVNRNIALLETEKKSYDTNLLTAISNKDTFGVGKSFKEIIDFTFEKEKEDGTVESIKPFNIQSDIKIIFVTKKLPPGKYPTYSISNFTDYDSEGYDIENFSGSTGGTLPIIDRFTYDKSYNTLGLSWENIGSSEPQNGFKIINKWLSEELKKRTTFTASEWERYGNKYFRPEYYVKSGNNYFKPNGYYDKNQTVYEYNVTDSIICDIWAIGSGAPGEWGWGSGGGGGAVVYAQNVELNAGTYKIYVGGDGNKYYYQKLSNEKIDIKDIDENEWEKSNITQFSGISRINSDGSEEFIVKAMGGAIDFSNKKSNFIDRGNKSGGSRSGNIGTILNENISNGGYGCSSYNKNNRYYYSGCPRTVHWWCHKWRGNNVTSCGNGSNGPEINVNGTKTHVAGGGGGGTYWWKHRWFKEMTGSSGRGGLGGGGNGGNYGHGGDGSEFGAGGGGGRSRMGVHTLLGGNGGSGTVIIKINSFSGNCESNSSCFSPTHLTSAHGNARQAAPQLIHFTNYNPNEMKYGTAGGYIFLEKNISYNNINITLSNNPSIIYDIQSNIESLNNNDVLLDTKNNIGKQQFTPTHSGFYKFYITFISKNIDTRIISSNFNISCDVNGSYLNLKDYIFINQLWPDAWNTNTRASGIDKVRALNNYFKDMKYTNNTTKSVEPLVIHYLNTEQNDIFNIHYWDNKIKDIGRQILSEYKLNDSPICETSNAYNNRNYANFTQKCNELQTLNNFKRTFISSTSSNNLRKLFEGAAFKDPKLIPISINDTFTSSDKNISDYITYEKKSDSLNRTQKDIDGPYYNYFEDEDTERSIYVKAS